jgi:hypothetical protein
MQFMHTYFSKIQSNDITIQPMRESLNATKRNFWNEGIFTKTSGSFDRILNAGTLRFKRHIQLPRLIPVGPTELADQSFAARLRIVRRLARALRGERARGRAGHWTYSLKRHVGLLQAYRAERTALRVLFPGKVGRMA